MDNNIFVALEGLEGVGKTIVGGILAQKLCARYIKCPAGLFAEMKKKVRSDGDINVRFHFFLAANYSASAVVKTLLRKYSVVCDRYLLSTFVYHKVRGANVQSVSLDRLSMVKPTVTFFLDADDNTIFERLSASGDPSNGTFWSGDKPALREKIREEYRKFPVVIINTNGKSPTEVCDEMLQWLDI